MFLLRPRTALLTCIVFLGATLCQWIALFTLKAIQFQPAIAAPQHRSANTTLLTNDFTGVWIQVSDRKAQLYSAFFDDRLATPTVRVLAHVECNSQDAFFCVLHGSNLETTTVRAKLTMINSNCQDFEAHFIDCQLCDGLASFKPLGVQVFGNESVLVNLARITPIIPVQYSTRRETSSAVSVYPLAVCIHRLYDWYDWILLILFVEFHRHQGATKFVVYHRSWTADTDRVVQYYQKQGILDVLPYPPVPSLFYGTLSTERLRDQQILLMNDCIYSLRGKAKFVAILDLDEFLLPASPNETLLSFADRVTLGRFNSTGAIQFPNIFFVSDFPNAKLLSPEAVPDSAIIANLSEYLFGQIRCRGEPHPWHVRSKYIVRPEKILRASIHEVFEFDKTGHETDDVEILVEHQQAALFHLRKIDGNFGENEQLSFCGKDVAQGECARSSLEDLGSAMLKRFTEVRSFISQTSLKK